MKKIEPIIVGVGAFATIIGLILISFPIEDSYPVTEELKGVVTILGIGTFLTGVVLTLYKLYEEISEIRALVQEQNKHIDEKVSIELQDIKKKVSKVTHYTEILELRSKSAELNLPTDAAALPAKAFGAALVNLMSERLPKLETYLRDLEGGGSPSIEEYPLIDGILQEIGKRIPDNMYWAGISALNNPKAWANKTEEFDEFRNRIHRKSKTEKMKVKRLYWFPNLENVESMKPVFESDLEHNLELKILVTPKQPEDISVIYQIPKEGDISMESKPICGFIFDNENGSDLAKIRLVCAEEAKSLSQRFFHYWEQGTPLHSINDIVNFLNSEKTNSYH
ncbi:hypothetical protein [Thalassomonas sp. RHCl1]|uniref:hypothetical protein n=1 Tax=Thalassomonas sp. RHCl1 TaxID=2995320 RepID=UPI00248C12C3|nr:hypothetical protein [Thalassomonas sp. RHCl1]